MNLEALSQVSTIVACLAPIAGVAFWLLVKSQCVSKKTYYERIEKTDELRAVVEHRLVELEKQAALAAQPMASMNATLVRIEALLGESVAQHRDLEHRVTRIEAAGAHARCPKPEH